MDKTRLHNLISDEAAGRAYILGKCFADARPLCPRCRCSHLYELADGRFRCSECLYTFHEFSGRWINRGRLSCARWLTLAGLFQDGNTVSTISSHMGISYGTAYQSVRVIRLSMAASASDAKRVLGWIVTKGTPRRGNCPIDYGEIPVFGIWWEGAGIRVCLLSEFTAENLLGLGAPSDRLGSIVLVSDFKGLEGLVFYDPSELRRYRSVSFPVGDSPALRNGRFWSWAKRELHRYRGVSYWNFPLYLKELEFRFNNKDSDFYENMMNCLCRLVPETMGGVIL